MTASWSKKVLREKLVEYTTPKKEGIIARFGFKLQPLLFSLMTVVEKGEFDEDEICGIRLLL